jgi:hypothetical protein
MKITNAQELIEQDTGFTQKQAEQLALLFLSKSEGDSEDRMVKALTLLERMLTDAQADVALISILLSGDATFDLSPDQTELLFKITDKGQRAVELTSLLEETKDGPIQ